MAVSACGRLGGRLALVTGAGSGIGRAVCNVFAKEGATVAAVDINETGITETVQSLSGEGHHSFLADISSSTSVNDLMAQVKDKFSRSPSVAVNSAGITRDKTILKLTEENFDKVIDVNLKGTFLLNQAVAKLMIDQKVKGGSIVNISSIVGKVGNIGQTNYGASKAGVIGFTKSAAKELAKFDIRVNAILPGFIETPMTDVVPEHLISITKMLIPAARLGKPEEVAEACLFLASDSSSYITGAALEVTGGLFM